MWISVHHIVQALIFLALMLPLIRFRKYDFQLGRGDSKQGINYLVKFTIIFGVGSLVSHGIALALGSFQPFPYPMESRNIIGYLGFQLLLSGPSEELIFRAFAMTIAGMLVSGRLLRGRVSYANLIAAVIFALAHVGFSFNPFTLRYHPYQLLMSFVLGLFYGDCYEKSGSVIYPMAMHSISNVIMVGATAIATAFL
ncbi:hypothetical protein JCM12856_23330 [Spirochaeta dissipatitropha]